MSDLAATNCGGNCNCNEGGCSNIIWLILLLSCCGNGSFCGGNNNGCGCGGNECLWLILLLFCCGGNGFGFGGCNNGGFC